MVGAVVVIYLLPIVGSLVFSIALLMLYFEKLVFIKHSLANHDELTNLLNVVLSWQLVSMNWHGLCA